MLQPREIDYPFRSSVDRRPRWWRFALSLLWMAFPLGALFSDNASPQQLVLVLAGFAGFVVCYGNALVGPWERITWRQRVPWLVGGAVIATALVIGDRPDWGILFIFLAVVAGARLPEPQSIVGVGLAGALATGTMLIAGSEGWTALSVGLSAGGIGFLFLLISRLARANDELRAAQEELAQAAVAEERLRFARDLHDLLGHSLSLIALKASWPAGWPTRPGRRGRARWPTSRPSRRGRWPRCARASAATARPSLADELASARTALAAAGIEPRRRRRRSTLPPDGRATLLGVGGAGGRPPTCSATAGARSRDRGRRRRRRRRSRSSTTARGAGGRRRRQRAGRACASGRAPRRDASRPGRGPAAASGCGVAGRRGPGVIRVLIAEDQAMVRGALARAAGAGARHRGRRPRSAAATRCSPPRSRAAAGRRAARHRDAGRWTGSRRPRELRAGCRAAGC